MSDRTIHVAAIQCPLGDDRETNVARVLAHLEQAARDGAQVVLPPELFEGVYFCREQDERYFDWAHPLDDAHPTLRAVRALCKAHRIVVPVSLYEREGPAYYNSVAIVGVDGEVLGTYRKSHIPDGPGYQEKYYFHPGDTGFRVWPTPYGTIGVGICWDQWFPEAARAMVLQGAEVLFYPTAIGSEPAAPDVDTSDPWQRAMIGHAVSNSVPVVAANRIGDEGHQVFYGRSFIADPRGDKVAEASRADETVLHATFDRDALQRRRAGWGFFRDRRPALYGVLGTADGRPTR